MASSSSNSAGIPVSLTLTNAATGAPTVLSSAQASQLLQKLRSLNQVPGGTQAIKIQAIQTNPLTGAKQIVAIPIQATGAGNKLGSSPVKIIKMAPSTIDMAGNQTGRSQIPPGVKVVKLAPNQVTTASVSSSPRTIYTAKPAQLSGHNTPTKPIITVASASSVHSASMAASGNLSDLHHQSDSGSGRGVKRAAIDFDAFSDAKRRKTSEKGGKGLRHFSMKVCEKVQAKGLTSYNEVADELVKELTDPRCSSPTDQQYDQKNIRRRVYDALNVLMAMNIISKEKKEIRWLGLPTNSVKEANSLELEKVKRIDRIKAKTHQLQDLILQQIAFKNLVERNREREKRDGGPTPNSAIQLPFIIVNTSKKTVIDCSISNDKMEYLFNFDDTFEIHDDMEVLKRMGLSLGLERGQVLPDDLAKARAMVPRALEQYVIDLAKNGLGVCSNLPRVSSPKMLAMEEPSEVDIDGQSETDDSDVDV